MSWPRWLIASVTEREPVRRELVQDDLQDRVAVADRHQRLGQRRRVRPQPHALCRRPGSPRACRPPLRRLSPVAPGLAEHRPARPDQEEHQQQHGAAQVDDGRVVARAGVSAAGTSSGRAEVRRQATRRATRTASRTGHVRPAGSRGSRRRPSATLRGRPSRCRPAEQPGRRAGREQRAAATAATAARHDGDVGRRAAARSAGGTRRGRRTRASSAGACSTKRRARHSTTPMRHDQRRAADHDVEPARAGTAPARAAGTPPRARCTASTDASGRTDCAAQPARAADRGTGGRAAHRRAAAPARERRRPTPRPRRPTAHAAAAPRRSTGRRGRPATAGAITQASHSSRR